MSLVARHLEANGIPTIIIGSAFDIVERCRVPRFLFVDFPLGNPCGKPGDLDMQNRIVEQGLGLLERAQSPWHVEESAEQWGNDAWKDNYMAVNDENRAALAQMGEELRARRQSREKRDID